MPINIRIDEWTGTDSVRWIDWINYPTAELVTGCLTGNGHGCTIAVVGRDPGCRSRNDRCSGNFDRTAYGRGNGSGRSADDHGRSYHDLAVGNHDRSRSDDPRLNYDGSRCRDYGRRPGDHVFDAFNGTDNYAAHGRSGECDQRGRRIREIGKDAGTFNHDRLLRVYRCKRREPEDEKEQFLHGLIAFR